ncbi:SLAM family member 5-like [Xenopus tropicalis]|uniref:SLAM family member 5-like n=1 Tax=Xenopus tropicalis TaxID=8364 RepID=A0A803KCM8_XENTR|nr:SLAM family member 5-like [Xenopus tropicalis]
MHGKVSEELTILLVLPSLLLVLGRQEAPLQVSGLLNQSVTLSHHPKLTNSIIRVIWERKRNGETLSVAEYQDPHLSVQSKQFTNRLEASDGGTVLRIRELRMEDSDVYKALITRINATVKTMCFNLTVYEPVPLPDIKTEGVINSKTWCNFTLHCSVPRNVSSGSLSWLYRYKGPGYQHYTGRSTVEISLHNRADNMELLCLVQNPGDKKNQSVYVHDICHYAVPLVGHSGK